MVSKCDRDDCFLKYGQYPYMEDQAPEDCERCHKYFNERTLDTCPFATEVHNDHRKCRCTEADRYACYMQI